MIRRQAVAGYEALFRCTDPRIGYRAFIAIHSTARGPATGGTRMAEYSTESAAIEDALRLSRSMSYKAAILSLPVGGGKSVIMTNGIRDRDAILHKHAEMIDLLGGRYVTAPDFGTSAEDMEVIAKTTPFVSRHRATDGANGADTARGVLAAIRGAARERFGARSLVGLRIGIQGVGHVGAHLARLLIAAGAEVLVSDIVEQRARSIASELEAQVVAPNDIHGAKLDVFSPCALGGGLNAGTIAELRCGAAVGGANNQLAQREDALRLLARGILFVPDYLASAGGLAAGVYDRLGMTAAEILRRIDEMEDIVAHVVERARLERRAPLDVADEIATGRLAVEPQVRRRAFVCPFCAPSSG